MANIESALAQAEKEYQAEIAKLKAAHEEKKSDLLLKASDDLGKALTGAVDFYNAIPSHVRQNVWSYPSIAKALHGLGLTAKKAKSKGATRSKVTDEEMLAYLATERSTTDVINNFGQSKITIRNHLNALKDSGKAKNIPKKGRMMFWIKV
jgi:hypothetical protein